MISTIDILSIPIWNVTMEEARNLAFKCIDEGRAASIATANAEMVMRAQTGPASCGLQNSRARNLKNA